MQSYKNLLVPTSLLGYSLTAKITKQLRIYLFLKSNFNGVLKPDYTFISQSLNMSHKTLKRHIKWLLDNNWIGTDGEYLFIRKWSRICKYNEINGNTGIYLEDLENIYSEEKFKAYAVSAVYAQLIRSQKAVKFNQVRKNRRTVPRKNLPASDSYFGVANSLLATILGISKTKAIELKQLAIKHKFIKCFHRFKEYQQTKQTRDFARLVRKQGKTSVLLRNGRLVEQLYDEMFVIFPVKRVRKSRLEEGK